MGFLDQSSSIYKSPEGNFVNFHWDNQLKLTVTIETPRFYIRSVQEEDLRSYTDLLKEVVADSDNPFSETQINRAVHSTINEVWLERQKDNDPYSALTVLTNDTFEFVGHVSINHVNKPGEGELDYMAMDDYQQPDIQNEVVSSMLNEFVPATIEEGYKMDGEVLNRISRSTRPRKRRAIAPPAASERADFESTEDASMKGA
jgi:hypothetical protein